MSAKYQKRTLIKSGHWLLHEPLTAQPQRPTFNEAMRRLQVRNLNVFAECRKQRVVCIRTCLVPSSPPTRPVGSASVSARC